MEDLPELALAVEEQKKSDRRKKSGVVDPLQQAEHTSNKPVHQVLWGNVKVQEKEKMNTSRTPTLRNCTDAGGDSVRTTTEISEVLEIIRFNFERLSLDAGHRVLFANEHILMTKPARDAAAAKHS